MMAILMILLAFGSMASQSNGVPEGVSSEDPFLLGPSGEQRPVKVETRFELLDINDINNEAETIEITGVLTLRWLDPRQAFDPAQAGVAEKIYQGNFQFNEISTGWFPQVFLVNQSGLNESSNVVLRIRADGASTLVQSINATVEVEFNVRRFPFDAHRLEVIFEAFGFDRSEVELGFEPEHADCLGSPIDVSQFVVHSARLDLPDRTDPRLDHVGKSSAIVLALNVQRDPFFVIRLVIIPLTVIVFLSFTVFWMDRSSLGDRINVSFIGILTGVAYQIIVNDSLPHISYFTLIHGFLNLSFITMCATVVINLVVGGLDKRGHYQAGDAIDRRCRWIFPLAFGAINALFLAVAFLWY